MLSRYTIYRFAFMLAISVFIGPIAYKTGAALSGPLGMDEIALAWTFLLMFCGLWGWHADLAFNRISRLFAAKDALDPVNQAKHAEGQWLEDQDQ